MSTEVIEPEVEEKPKRQPKARVPAVVEPPEQLTGWLRVIDRMIEKNMSSDLLTKVFELQQKAEAEMQRKAFVEAFAAFKAEAPTAIARSAKVNFTSAKGTTDYNYVPLDKVVDALVPVMSGHGLAHSWETNQDEKGTITVTCRLEHEAGHSKTVTLRGQPDQTGNKNPIQAVGSTVYYLERYTLLAVLGIAQGGADNDGAGSQEPTEIEDEKREEIAHLLKVFYPTKPEKFWAWVYKSDENKGLAGLDSVTHLRAKKELLRMKAEALQKGAKDEDF